MFFICLYYIFQPNICPSLNVLHFFIPSLHINQRTETCFCPFSLTAFLKSETQIKQSRHQLTSKSNEEKLSLISNKKKKMKAYTLTPLSKYSHMCPMLYQALSLHTSLKPCPIPLFQNLIKESCWLNPTEWGKHWQCPFGL